MPKVKFVFAWYDFWIGAYWDCERRSLYILPLPMLGVVIDFGAKPDYGPCKKCGEAPMSGECLMAVHECLETLGLDMSATPAMFYPEAIQRLRFDTLKDAGAFPDHPAKYRYTPNVDGYTREEIAMTPEQTDA